jgi:hypothetical protein
MLERQDALGVIVAVTAALAAVLVAVVTAFALSGPPGPRAANAAPSAACQEWTDGCVVCARTPEGQACSMPGIACTRGPAKCLKP